MTLPVVEGAVAVDNDDDVGAEGADDVVGNSAPEALIKILFLLEDGDVCAKRKRRRRSDEDVLVLASRRCPLVLPIRFVMVP